VLYVEHKTTRALATKLLKRMRQYGDSGFSLDDPDRGDDPLRKAKYLVRSDSHPIYFGISAVDYRQLFKVEYLDGNRFKLIEDARPFSGVLAERARARTGGSPPWSPVDPLAIEMDRLCPQVWISVGSKRTAYNFYCPAEHGDAIVVGVYEDGAVWTDLAGLGEQRATRLVLALAGRGITLDVTKTWAFWRMGRTRLKLQTVDPIVVAEAVRTMLGEDRAEV
jgi:hypothetical protein